MLVKLKEIILIFSSIFFVLTLNAQNVTFKEKNGKYGFFQKRKKVLEYQYDDVVNRKNDVFAVKKDQKWGIVNSEGVEVISCKYDTIMINGDRGFIVNDNGKFGVIDIDENILLEKKYENIDHYYGDSLALVKYEGVWSYLSNNVLQDNSELLIFKRVDQKPIFEQCDKSSQSKKELKRCADRKMLEFVYENINYPEEAKIKGIEGTVVIQFLISKTGEVKSPLVVRDIGGGCGEAAMQVVHKMHNWIPAEKDGMPVNYHYYLPVKFRMK